MIQRPGGGFIMSNSFLRKSSLGLLAFFCLTNQATVAQAEWMELHTVVDEVRGGVFLKEALEKALEARQVQRIIELYEYAPKGWILESAPVEFNDDVTSFKFTLTPEEMKGQSSNQESASSGAGAPIGVPPSFLEVSAAAPPVAQGWWGYWDRAKGAVAGATQLALSAAKAVGGYAKQTLSVRTIAGSITSEGAECAAPYASEGVKFIVNLDESDPLVYSVLSQFSVRICHDARDWESEKKIGIQLGIEIEPGVAYSSFVDPAVAAMKSETYARAWLRAFQEVIQEQEFKLLKDRWDDLADDSADSKK